MTLKIILIMIFFIYIFFFVLTIFGSIIPGVWRRGGGWKVCSSPLPSGHLNHMYLLTFSRVVNASNTFII